MFKKIIETLFQSDLTPKNLNEEEKYETKPSREVIVEEKIKQPTSEMIVEETSLLERFSEESVEIIFQEDIILTIVTFLPIKSALNLSLICKSSYQQLLGSEKYWERITESRFKITKKIDEKMSWKSIFLSFQVQTIYGKDFGGAWVGDYWRITDKYKEFVFPILSLSRGLWWFDVSGSCSKEILPGNYFGYLCIHSHDNDEPLDLIFYNNVKGKEESDSNKMDFRTSGFQVYKFGPYKIPEKTTFRVGLRNTKSTYKPAFSIAFFSLCHESTTNFFEKKFLKVKEDVFAIQTSNEKFTLNKIFN